MSRTIGTEVVEKGKKWLLIHSALGYRTNSGMKLAKIKLNPKGNSPVFYSQI
jgi:hypothetical protein